jgi:hypothetical protein
MQMSGTSKTPLSGLMILRDEQAKPAELPKTSSKAMPQAAARAWGVGSGVYEAVGLPPRLSVILNAVRNLNGWRFLTAFRMTEMDRFYVISAISETISSPYVSSFFSPTPEISRRSASDAGLAFAISRMVASWKIT